MSFIFRENYLLGSWGDGKLLNTRLFSCGYEIVGPGYSNSGLKRGRKPLVIWQYTLAGRGRIRLGDSEYDIPPGSCMLAMIPEDHCYFLPPGEDSWKFIYVTVGGDEPARLATALRNKCGVVFDIAEDSVTVAAAWNIIEKARLNHLGNIYESSSLAYNFMMSLLRSNESIKDSPLSEDEMIIRVKNYCEKHIAETISVDNLAQITGYSRWHFTRLFRELYGKSPHRFIVEQRIDYALQLLQASGEPLKVIAERCGFDDASYFCKVFKSICNVTPDGFRRGEAVVKKQ